MYDMSINLYKTLLFYREKDGVKLTGAGQGLAILNLGEKLIMQKK